MRGEAGASVTHDFDSSGRRIEVLTNAVNEVAAADGISLLQNSILFLLLWIGYLCRVSVERG